MYSNVQTGPGLKNSWNRLQAQKSSLSSDELNQYESLQNKKTKNNAIEIRTRESASTILADYIGETFHVYNGQKFVPIFIKKEIVGYKLGSFVNTRIFNENNRNGSSKSTIKRLFFISISFILKFYSWVKKFIHWVSDQVTV